MKDVIRVFNVATECSTVWTRAYKHQWPRRKKVACPYCLFIVT